jgi:hypothetical protein
MIMLSIVLTLHYLIKISTVQWLEVSDVVFTTPSTGTWGWDSCTDEDAGSGSRVVYSNSLVSRCDYFAVEAESGQLVVARALDTGLLGPGAESLYLVFLS